MSGLHVLTRYEVDVIGHLWNGGQGSYTYRTNSDHEPTPEDVRRLSGDFSGLVDFQVWELKPCECCGHDRPVSVREWAQPESAERWDDMHSEG